VQLFGFEEHVPLPLFAKLFSQIKQLLKLEHDLHPILQESHDQVFELA
jgi:hypothetical protein